MLRLTEAPHLGVFVCLSFTGDYHERAVENRIASCNKRDLQVASIIPRKRRQFSAGAVEALGVTLSKCTWHVRLEAMKSKTCVVEVCLLLTRASLGTEYAPLSPRE